MVEEPCGNILLLGSEGIHRTLEVLLHDVLRAAQPLERRDPQSVGARGALFFPETLHDELEVRRLDPCRVFRAFDRAASTQRRLDLAGADLVQHAVDELWLGRTRTPVSAA